MGSRYRSSGIYPIPLLPFLSQLLLIIRNTGIIWSRERGHVKSRGAQPPVTVTDILATDTTQRRPRYTFFDRPISTTNTTSIFPMRPSLHATGGSQRRARGLVLTGRPFPDQAVSRCQLSVCANLPSGQTWRTGEIIDSVRACLSNFHRDCSGRSTLALGN